MSNIMHSNTHKKANKNNYMMNIKNIYLKTDNKFIELKMTNRAGFFMRLSFVSPEKKTLLN